MSKHQDLIKAAVHHTTEADIALTEAEMRATYNESITVQVQKAIRHLDKAREKAGELAAKIAEADAQIAAEAHGWPPDRGCDD